MYQLLAIGLLAAAVIGFFNHYENIVGENKAAAQVIQTCNSDKAGLEGALGDANKSAQAVKDAADARVKIAEAEAAKAKKDATAHVTEAIAIMNRQLPPGANACEAARDLIAGYAKSRRK